MLGKIGRLADPHRRREAVATVRLFGLLLCQRVICWLTHQKLIIVVLLEHLGDIVACQPVAAYLRSQYPRSRLIWICKPQYKDLIRFDPDVDMVATVPCLMSWLRLSKFDIGDQQVNLNIAGRGCGDCGRRSEETSTNMTITLDNFFRFGGLLPAFCLASGLPPLSESPNIYLPDRIEQALTRLDLPRHYVVLHCSSLDSTKDWEPHKWAELAKMVTVRVGISIIEIGLASTLEKCGTRDFVNLCGKTSLLETAAIIKQAIAFVGIDSGPAHLANAVKCPGVILLGEYYEFKDYLPYTGYFADKGARIVRAQGPVSLLSVDEVFDAVIDRMPDSASRISAANLEDRSLPNAVGA